MKSFFVFVLLLLSASVASAFGSEEARIDQIRDLTAQQGFIPTSMTRYGGVPEKPEKIDEMLPLMGKVVAGRHRVELEPYDGRCFAYPRVEPIARHTDLQIKQYQVEYEKETVVTIPSRLILDGATIDFDQETKFVVRNPTVFDFEFHLSPRYLLSIIQYYKDESDIVAKVEDLLLIHSVIVSDIITKNEFGFRVNIHSKGSVGFTESDFERLGLILGFKVVSLQRIDASEKDIWYTKTEETGYGATLRFESSLHDSIVILVDKTDGTDNVIERSTVKVEHDTKPLIDAYFVTSNLLYFGSFGLSIGEDLSVSVDRSSVIALRWKELTARDMMKECEAAE